MLKKILKSKKRIIYFFLIIIIFFILIFNINKILPLSFKSYSSAIDLANSFKQDKYCHNLCWQKRYENMEMIILATEKDKYQGLDKLMEYISGNVMTDDFKNFALSYLFSKGKNIDKEYFQDYITRNLDNNNLNHMLKTKIIKHAGFDDFKYDLKLENIVKDSSLALTQRKTALRALWSSFNSNNVKLYKNILKDSDIALELKIEAIKAMSNIDNKEKYLLASDLEIYEDLLRERNLKLEKSILFLLSDYKEENAEAVNEIIENHNFANSNYLLANNILNS
ncbi:hypothetical protein K9M50_03360 [Patescibacteria group bacterium]|nr:hypothetical protein [Patescibacteria group bacterium]